MNIHQYKTSIFVEFSCEWHDANDNQVEEVQQLKQLCSQSMQ